MAGHILAQIKQIHGPEGLMDQ